MSGPLRQTKRDYVVPVGEGQVLFSPSQLAYKILNFERTNEGTLRSVKGPCPNEPNRGKGYFAFGSPHGIFHAGLVGGMVDFTLIRAGTKLYRHAGWSRTYVELAAGLSDEPRAGYPDQFVNINDKIIWTNGIDRALVITADGVVDPLGYDDQPGAPTIMGPAQPAEEDKYTEGANSQGFSWPGRIGTPGDIMSGYAGSLLAGTWIYYAQYEDIHGNLSPLSVPSNPLVLATAQADPYVIGGTNDSGADIDDLMRMAVARLGGDAPDHTAAIRLYRTLDLRRNAGLPRLAARIPGTNQTLYPDSLADSELGPEAVQVASVPVFRVMCAHGGSLIIANTAAEPGIVRRSQPGFPGTFPEDDWVVPDSGGAEVTALASHGNRLLAFTETAVYDITDFANPVLLARGIGCVAPRSVQALPSGGLIWLGRDGFYEMQQDGGIRLVSRDIQHTLDNDINFSRARKAVSVLDPVSREYRCALTPAGKLGNRLILCYDGEAWRRLDLGIEVDDICARDMWPYYVVFAGRDISAAQNHVMIFGHEYIDYTPPARTYEYLSGWLRSEISARTPVHVRDLYVAMVDEGVFDPAITVTFYKNGSYVPVTTRSDLRAVGRDENSAVIADLVGTAVIGAAKAHARRLFWRRIPIGKALEDARTWAFKLSSTSPMHLGGFAAALSVSGNGDPDLRLPLPSDT